MKEYLVEQNNNAKNLCEGFGSPMGTSQYYNMGLCLITDGVKELREKFNCAWLVAKIAVMKCYTHFSLKSIFYFINRRKEEK